MPVLCPDLQGVDPRPEAYSDYPQADLFSGFVNLSGGSVANGQLDNEDTTFHLKYGDPEDDPTWGPEKTPRSVLITLPFDGPYAVLLLDAAKPELRTRIYVKPGARIMAGCAREVDITGNGSGYVQSEHFANYYKVAPPPGPPNPALPETPSVPVDACSPVRWP